MIITHSISAFIALFTVVSLKEIEILLLTDIHLDLFYKADASVDGMCRNSNLKADWEALFGRTGCDTPAPLFEQLLHYCTKTVNPKYVLINGDLVGHGIALQYGKDTVLETQEVVFDLVASFFPEAIILTSLGNNDQLRHNNVPRRRQAQEFYQRLYEIEFSETTVAQKNRNLLDSKAEENFKRGGFYSIEIADNLTLMVINSIFNSVKNLISNDPDGAQMQMEWIESTFENAPEGMKFIPFYHVPVGVDTFGKYMWHQEYENKYLELQRKYKDKIVIDLVSHIHQSTFRGYSDAKTGEVYGAALHSSAVSPVYNNNPSFRVYTLESEGGSTTIKGYNDFSLQLEKLYSLKEGNVFLEKLNVVWNSQYTNEFLGINEFTPEAIQLYWKRIIESEEDFENYLLQSGGYDQSQLEAVKDAYTNTFNVNFPTSTKKNWHFYCKLMCPGYQNYQYCLNNPPHQ